MKISGAILHLGAPDIEWQQWMHELQSHFTEKIDFRNANSVDDLRVMNVNDIHYACGFRMPTGIVSSLPNLSMGAGVDGILRDASIPISIPIVRMVDEGLGDAMTEYIVLNTLAWHRDVYKYDALQKSHEWKELIPTPSRKRTVGILGFGHLGMRAGNALKSLNFNVIGWKRSPLRDANECPAVDVYVGPEELNEFAARCNILICLLPLTPYTIGVINYDLLKVMPRGSFLINAGRGKHVVIDDLLRAIDEGIIAGASLDVFPEEPLPSTSPLWDNDKIKITPHVAAITDPEISCRYVARQIMSYESGGSLLNVVNRDLGY